MSKKALLSGMDIKNIIILAPLIAITVFSLSFVQMKSLNNQRTMKQDISRPQTKLDSNALQLVTQPALPVLDTSVGELMPAPIPAPSGSISGKAAKQNLVGPSSTEAGKTLQPNSSNLNNNANNELQATRKAIRLEEAKL